MTKAIQEILDTFPPSSVNNSRDIVKRKLERMHDNPNDRNRKELENLGISVDHDDYFEHYDEIKSHVPEE